MPPLYLLLIQQTPLLTITHGANSVLLDINSYGHGSLDRKKVLRSRSLEEIFTNDHELVKANCCFQVYLSINFLLSLKGQSRGDSFDTLDQSINGKPI